MVLVQMGLSVNIVCAQVLDSLFGLPFSFEPPAAIYGTTSAGYDNRDSRAYAVLHLSDGKIILAGHTSGNDGTDLAFLRLLPNGHYDETFAPGGLLRLDMGYYADSCLAAVLNEEGKIVVAGCARQQNEVQYRGLVARMNVNGQIDTSFGNNGHVIIDLPADYEVITKVVALQDGRIIIAGNAYYGNSVHFADSTQVFVGRLWASGAVDSTFGNNGFVYRQFDSNCRSSLLGDIAVDTEGRIIISGASFFLYPEVFMPGLYCSHLVNVYRMMPDGQLDSSFGNAGRLTLTRAQGRAKALHTGANNEILLAGSVTNFQNLFRPVHTYFGRIQPMGSMDSSFAFQGNFIRFIIGGIFPAAPFDLLEFEQHYYVGQEDNAHGNSTAFGLLRFSRDGEWDMSFGENGIFRTSFLMPYTGGRVSQLSTVDSSSIFISGYHRNFRDHMFIAKINLTDVVSSTGNHAFDQRIKVFPNPVSGGRLYFDVSGLVSEGPLQIRLSDMQGRQVLQQANVPTGGVQSLDVVHLPTGMYVLEIYGSSYKNVEKVIIQR